MWWFIEKRLLKVPQVFYLSFSLWKTRTFSIILMDGKPRCAEKKKRKGRKKTFPSTWILLGVLPPCCLRFVCVWGSGREVGDGDVTALSPVPSPAPVRVNITPRCRAISPAVIHRHIYVCWSAQPNRLFPYFSLIGLEWTLTQAMMIRYYIKMHYICKCDVWNGGRAQSRSVGTR